jgi:ABC-2 type transport system ATP-binding protein
MISTGGLTKKYGRVVALRDLTLNIQPGEVFGLLGPNGSGKTTCIRIVLGFLKPSAGWAKVDGLDCWKRSSEVRERISYLPGEIRLMGHMRGIDCLRFLSRLRSEAAFNRAVAIAERIMQLDLARKVRNYSTGMKQKLALAQVFADPVDIVILDEPTSALDPSARELVLDLVREAKANGQTVIFSGHVLSEVERVADRVGIMRKGRLMHVEDMHTRRAVRMVLARFPGEVPTDFPDDLKLTIRERNGEVAMYEHHGEAPALLSWLSNQGVVDVAIGTEDLKSLYDQFHGPNAKDKTEDEN